MYEAGGLMSYGAERSRLISPRRHLCGQDPQGHQASRPAGGAADKVRARDQSESGETDRPDDSAERAGESGQGDQVMAENQAAMPGLN